MVRVLHIGVSSTSGVFGGVEKFLTDYYSHINHAEVRFDFLFCRGNSLAKYNNQELLEGSKIKALYALRDRDNSLSSYRRLYKAVSKEIQTEKYDIVHVNTALIPAQIACLLAAKKNGISIRIAHSHSAGNLTTGNLFKRKIKNIVYKGSKFFIRNLATDYFACSKEAGIFLFGKKGVKSNRFRIIKNAIDPSLYKFNYEERKRIRDIEKINDSTVICGNVGRLDPVKNLRFLIDVFLRYHKFNEDSQLWIVGDGEDREILENYIKVKDCSPYVKLFGEKHNISTIMQAFDIFLFPSLKEGLGIVAIEAQAAGLPVLASDTIPQETNITKNIKYLSLDEGIEKWSAAIGQSIDGFQRTDVYNAIVEAGYDISQSANELESFYIKKVKERSGC